MPTQSSTGAGYSRATGALTKEHEASLELFERMPSLFPVLLRSQNIDVPEDVTVRRESGRFTEHGPYELNADGVLVLERNDKPVNAIVYKVQRGPVAEKRWTWPRYLAGAWARFKTPVVLLVYCPSESIAVKARKPIVLGPNCTVVPTVVSTDSLPVIADPGEWEGDVATAVVSAFFHSGSDRAEEILTALCDLLATIDIEQARKYAGSLLETLPETASLILEKILVSDTYSYESAMALIERRSRARGEAIGEKRGEKRGERRGEKRGIVVGEIKALLSVLAARGVEVTDAARSRITACTDTDQFDVWLRRAVTITSVDDMLDD